MVVAFEALSACLTAAPSDRSPIPGSLARPAAIDLANSIGADDIGSGAECHPPTK
jgi:hypothetical protein